MKKTIFMLALVFLFFLSPLLPQEDKMMVIAVRAGIYLDPDVESPIIETVERGAMLSLLSTEKIRENWYYVSFYSEGKFINFTGFIHAKKIQVLLEKTNIRAEPDFTSEVIHQVQLGISLQAVGKAGEWYLVNLPPDEEGLIISGYIHQSFVQEIQEKKIDK